MGRLVGERGDPRRRGYELIHPWRQWLTLSVWSSLPHLGLLHPDHANNQFLVRPWLVWSSVERSLCLWSFETWYGISLHHDWGQWEYLTFWVCFIELGHLNPDHSTLKQRKRPWFIWISLGKSFLFRHHLCQQHCVSGNSVSFRHRHLNHLGQS